MLSKLAGTRTLIGLIVRRDRARLPVWIVGIAAFAAMSAVSVGETYATMQERLSYAALGTTSVVARAFNGPLAGTDIGSITLVETYNYLAILAAFMSVLAIVRHTRQNEETGRSELTGAAVVGHFASLSAALIVVALANLLVGGSIAAIFTASGLPVAGSIMTGAAVAATGLLFAGIAAVTSQLAQSARGASGLAGLCIGVAFLLRALGDSFGTIIHNGTALLSAWPSWLSPLGWGLQMQVYVQAKWWIFALFGASSIVCITVAYALCAKRDIGEGILAVRPGPKHAPKALLSPLGLAWRLQRNVLFSWVTGATIVAAAMGSMGNEVEELLRSNPDITAVMQQLAGGSGDITAIFYTGMMSFFGIAAAGYTLQSLLKIRAEESDGRLESLLTTAVSRPRWLWSHIFWALSGTILLLGLSGLGAGAAYIVTAGLPWVDLAGLVGATIVYIPAIIALMGFVILALGAVPRFSAALAWGGFIGCMVLGQVGAMLKLPHWVMNLSPFSHIPTVPAVPLRLLPLIILLGIGGILWATGMRAFRRRDIVTS